MTKLKKMEIIFVLLLCTIGVGVGLDNPIKTDEAYTSIHFAEKGLSHIFFLYNVPNNHPLHSLLVWVFLFLGHSVYLLRMPTFLSALGILMFVYLAVRKFTSSPLIALYSVLFTMTNFFFYQFAYEARGYHPSTLMMLLSIYFLYKGRGTNSRRYLNVSGIFAALCVWAVPTGIYYFIAWVIEILLDRKHPFRKRIKSAVLFAGVIILLYLPLVAYFVLDHFGKFSSSSPGGTPVLSYYLDLLSPATFSVRVFLVIPLIILGFFRTTSKRMIIVLLCIPLLLGLFRRTGYVRNYTYLVPIFAILWGLGINYLVGRVGNRVVRGAIALLLVIPLFYQTFPEYYKRMVVPVNDPAREIAGIVNTYLSKQGEYRLLVNTKEVEYFLKPEIRERFERSKRVPLMGAKKRIGEIMGKYPLIDKIGGFIAPELKHRIKIAPIRDNEVELFLISDRYMKHQKVMINWYRQYGKKTDRFTYGQPDFFREMEYILNYLGYKKKNWRIEEYLVIADNEDYVFLKLRLRKTQKIDSQTGD